MGGLPRGHLEDLRGVGEAGDHGHGDQEDEHRRDPLDDLSCVGEPQQPGHHSGEPSECAQPPHVGLMKFATSGGSV
jgi:hypothetical protein